jgi:DNA mismatch repair protein MutS
MMKQYRRIKEKNRGAVLFYRMGDFYEMFEDDAVTASKVLGLALTSRNHGGSGSTPLCGFPHHALDRYMARMIDSGYKVAVCEQVEDPKTAKGVVKRDIVEVVTRGTATHHALLKDKSNNFCAAVFENGDAVGLAGIDVSTGEFFCTETTPKKARAEIEKLAPAEVLFCEPGRAGEMVRWLKAELSGAVLTPLEDWRFSFQSATKDLTAHFGTATLEGFGVEGFKTGLLAAGAVFGYVKEQKCDRIGHVKKISPVMVDKTMALDGATIRNLELLTPLHPEGEKATLLSVLDHTKTAMGGRLLKRFIVNPLLDLDEITARQDGVAFYAAARAAADKLRTLLSGICDIERLNARIGYERATPRDLYALKKSLQLLPDIVALHEGAEADIVRGALSRLSGTGPVVEKLSAALVDDPPLAQNEGGIFRPGYNPELDAIVDGAREGKEWIAGLQAAERTRTGIGSLKVGYNKVFGYYIEISRTNLDKVPEGYVRKQTLVNGERYITEELKHWESVVLSAEEKQAALEAGLFTALRKWMCGFLEKLQAVSDSLARLDVLSGLAEAAMRNNYARPEVNDSDEIGIGDGRHPVIERLDFTEEFVPNNTNIKSSNHFIHLITGPNMAGKSTYLRQVGLIVLMAHMGGFVPAADARIGLCDRIFTRVGASDRLTKGQSTFLVEMQELANILNNATPKSLILLDEIGRGTSTFDGLSIAWALVEYIHNHKKVSAKTLFATHYHELAEIPLVLPGVKNYNVAVKEWNDEIIFLRKIVEGACDHSYGIQVARLAGVPEAVIARAKEVLRNLEQSELTPDQKPVIARSASSKKGGKKGKPEEYQLNIFDTTGADAVQALRNLDVERLSPIEALNRLAEIKKKLDL